MNPYIVSFLAVFLTAFIGNKFTNTSVNTQWYQCIKPSITLVRGQQDLSQQIDVTPPAFVFPIVWTILYILIGYSFGSILLNQPEQHLIIAFVINLFLNVIWCYYYFAKRDLQTSLVVILLLVASTIYLITQITNNNIKLLLVPYLLWISFATILNVLSVQKQPQCSLKD